MLILLCNLSKSLACCVFLYNWLITGDVQNMQKKAYFGGGFGHLDPKQSLTAQLNDFLVLEWELSSLVRQFVPPPCPQ